MSSFFQALRRFFFGGKPAKNRPKAPARPTQEYTAAPARPDRKCPKVQLLPGDRNRSSIPYWRLRKWRRVAINLYLGHFKTRLGRCHGVIKWNSQSDYSIYVHNVPPVILRGPHGACFAEVKPKKFRVHFAQRPRDLNSAIFYIETLLQEAFEHGY